MFACCDESGIHGDSRWWVIGAMWLPDDTQLPAYEGAVTALRQRTNCWGEFKWSSVDPRWLGAYREFLALTLTLPDLKFTSMVVDTSVFTAELMRQYHREGKRDEAYLKFMRQLLKHRLARYVSQGHRDFTLLYDRLSVEQSQASKFRRFLMGDMTRLARERNVACSFQHLSSVNSASRALMQATDIFTGATCASWTKRRDQSRKKAARDAITQQLVTWTGCELDDTTRPTSCYDLWPWRSSKVPA